MSKRLRDAARWRLAGLLMRLPRADRAREIELLAREADHPSLTAAVAAAVDATEGGYLALLGPGGPLSPREVSHRPLEDPGRLLAEIAAYHRAFGYRASAEDPADHLAAAADFAGYLLMKEAFAERSGLHRAAMTTREARAGFVDRHVRCTVRGMRRALEASGTPVPWLGAALEAIARLAGTDEAARCSA
ncbi:MAG TPA: hypothetical protein VD788_07365 [Candidatus Polarisedimenticolaceae bacterium]|nr:hypothetical protein [Candidatus Polarisedimenticolaceae bacterium]